MPIYDFKCNKCEFTKEYSTNKSLPKTMHPPKRCPICKKGRLIQQFSVTGQSVDIPGGYDYTHGKKAWKKNMSVSDQADVLLGNKDPY